MLTSRNLRWFLLSSLDSWRSHGRKTRTLATSPARSLIHAIVLGLSATGDVFGMQTTVVNRGRRGTRTGLDCFFPAKTRLAEMNVDIYQPGTNNQARRSISSTFDSLHQKQLEFLIPRRCDHR